MLNQTSRYALSILCYLARHGEERVPAHQIAADTATPANYVAKILAILRKDGLVEAREGLGRRVCPAPPGRRGHLRPGDGVVRRGCRTGGLPLRPAPVRLLPGPAQRGSGPGAARTRQGLSAAHTEQSGAP